MARQEVPRAARRPGPGRSGGRWLTLAAVSGPGAAREEMEYPGMPCVVRVLGSAGAGG
jgi:hypothetical protein